MPSRQPRKRLQDIIRNIDRIARHVAGLSRAAYLADEKTEDAVERCLQRITEAAVKLGDQMDQRHPEIPWREIRAFGNVLRHDYDEIRSDLIWITIEKRLKPLRAACAKELRRSQGAGTISRGR